MNDLISRQAAIDEIDEWIKAFRENGHKESAADACLIQDGIIQLPSAQPGIVRCEYCNKSREWPNGRWCSLFRASVNTDSYCSFGAKRKEGRKE